jgi:hypothetical protein
VLLLVALYTVNGSVRPASAAEIHDVLVWVQDRDIRKEIQDGILLPPLFSEADLRVQSMNLVQPITKTVSTAQVPASGTPASDTPPEYEAKYNDTSPMPYVDSSQFRRSSSKPDITPSETVQATKKFPVKSTILEARTSQPNKAPKMEKNTGNGKKYELRQNVTEGSPGETEDEATRPDPPVWSHAPITDEIWNPFLRLPSNEEYDGSSRYTHSILYGFNADF